MEPTDITKENETPFFQTLEVLENHHWVTRSLVGRGDFEFSGQLRFGGTWIGGIRSVGPNARLVVMKGARIVGRLDVDELSVEGTIEDADIRARSVRLLEGARVQGRVQAAQIVVEPGAILEGRVASVRKDRDATQFKAIE